TMNRRTNVAPDRDKLASIAWGMEMATPEREVSFRELRQTHRSRVANRRPMHGRDVSKARRNRSPGTVLPATARPRRLGTMEAPHHLFPAVG
ncbi:MAG: hypothetical protein AAF961_05470, partial [Planctomycetota bacterium]